MIHNCRNQTLKFERSKILIKHSNFRSQNKLSSHNHKKTKKPFQLLKKKFIHTSQEKYLIIQNKKCKRNNG